MEKVLPKNLGLRWTEERSSWIKDEWSDVWDGFSPETEQVVK